MSYFISHSRLYCTRTYVRYKTFTTYITFTSDYCDVSKISDRSVPLRDGNTARWRDRSFDQKRKTGSTRAYITAIRTFLQRFPATRPTFANPAAIYVLLMVVHFLVYLHFLGSCFWNETQAIQHTGGCIFRRICRDFSAFDQMRRQSIAIGSRISARALHSSL